MPKKLNVAQLHKKLQPIFNHYIRLRDTREALGHRIGDCISCGRRFLYAQLQAGHYLPVTHYATRYDPANVNAQCQQCNGYRKSNWPGYTLGLHKKYGKARVWQLLQHWGEKRVYTVQELEEMIAHYAGLVKGLEQ